MNLIDMLRRQDSALEAHPDVAVRMSRWDRAKWRVIDVRHAERPQIVLREIADVHALKCRPEHLGWYAAGPEGEISVTLVGSRSSASKQVSLPESPAPVELPWPADAGELGTVEEIRLHFDLPEDSVAQLYVQPVLNRQALYDLAKGKGIEIGPGPRPQIHSSDEVDVSYVEEKTGEYWSNVYDHDGKRGAAEVDWSRYHIGQASDLPAEDESLDFVFSSHVFEHLANPLGHLLHWKRKLKPGGVILAVVPNMDCTKDWCATPTGVEEIKREFEEKTWVPDIGHYRQFAAVRGHAESAERLMAEGKSIHVHFYDEPAIRSLLEECVTSYGFSRYQLIFSRNHKDFYYALWN